MSKDKKKLLNFLVSNSYKTVVDLEHYSVEDALRILARAADILLHEKDYDGQGYEVIQDCMETVDRKLSRWKVGNVVKSKELFLKDEIWTISIGGEPFLAKIVSTYDNMIITVKSLEGCTMGDRYIIPIEHLTLIKKGV